MRLITQFNEHQSEIIKAIKNSESIYMAVAFVKQSGINLLYDHLKSAARRNCAITIICGLDFAQTEPSALKTLRKLSLQFPSLQLYVASPESRAQIFHPKFYLFTSTEKSIVITGSANLTSGGLQNNNECSALIELPVTTNEHQKAVAYFIELLNSNFCEKATLYRIKKYESFYEEQKKKLKEIKAKMSDVTGNLSFDYKSLLKFYQEYKNEKDINRIYENKMTNYKKARAILNQLADADTLSRSTFIDLFETLVGSKTKNNLWHSGSIYRMKTHVFDYAKEFQTLVRFIRGNRKQPPAFVFTESKKLVAAIRGSGINTVTEIMMTYNHEDFANLNANPIKVLREAGGVHLKTHRNSFSGEDYEEYCDLVKEICETFSLRNMLEADSFFNDVYWEIVQ